MIAKRIKAFRYAFRGLAGALKGEQAFIIHGLAAILVILAGLYFGVGRNEWIILVLCICMVFAAELFNTAMEKLCDLYSKQNNEVIGFIKDVSAAAVLVTVIGAVFAGLVIFKPYIQLLFSSR